MQPILALADETESIAVIGGLSLGAIAIVGGYVVGFLRTRAREQSRREIAAYIAEGSMTIEQGERLMTAGEEEDKD